MQTTMNDTATEDPLYNKYKKTIVMDIDDTISFSDDYNDVAAYARARPNRPLIRIMQKMAQDGYKFVLFTSRGWISCKESLREAELKYRVQIELWLQQHNVPYERLLFGKPFGIFYVDDKAMTPDKFVNDFGSYH